MTSSSGSEHARSASTASLRLICIADGWPRDVFNQLLDHGDLPGIADLIEVGGLLNSVVSTVPSVSLVSHTSILTGTQPSIHRLPGHRWIDREQQQVVNYLSLRGPRLVNRDIAPGVATLFERVDDARSIQGVIERGASHRHHFATMAAGPILNAAAAKMVIHRSGTYVVWLPRVDALSHTHGPRSSQVRDEIAATSRAIGSLASRLRDNGLYDDLELLIVTDHGHRHIEHHCDITLAFQGLDASVRVNPRRYHRDAITVMTSGDSSAQVYLPPGLHDQTDRVAAEAVNSPDVELACWKSGSTWHYRTASGYSTATIDHDPAQGVCQYEVHAGIDPLGILGDEGHVSRCTFALDRPFLVGRFPDIVHQVASSYVSGRSGDILLFPAEGRHFGRGPRVAFRLGYHRGSHGGPTPAEVLVAAVYKGPVQIDWSQPVRSSDLLAALGFLPDARSDDPSVDVVHVGRSRAVEEGASPAAQRHS